MAKRVEALIKPELLVWARESASFTKETAANKLKIKLSKLEDWEKGNSRPTINQLRKIANLYKRPLAVFYLAEAPKDFDALKDFRRFPGTIGFRQPGKLKFEIRLANYRREVALDLMKDLYGKSKDFNYQIKITDDTEEAGSKIRGILEMDITKQKALSTDYDAFKYWRLAVEGTGVLVFQSSGIDVSEMRGFSIGKFPLPVIGINSKDSPRGRIFTLLHEFAHIMLRESGICDLNETSQRPPEAKKTEIFCNHAAGAALIPKSELLKLVGPVKSIDRWTNNQLYDLAKFFKASKEVVLRRLLICKLTTEGFYKKKRKEFIEEYRKIDLKKKEGFVPPDVKSISRFGLTFTRLVIDGYNNERITASDLSDYLNIRLNHLPKITSVLFANADKIRPLL
jgi:Zn-dependent peptidase ImmA (M78 family)/DNA-binding XRE family transcriptional regulator